MGNAGSAHNLQNECIQSELNWSYNQQYLRRTTGEIKNKTSAVLGGWSSDRNLADCKVLPKSTENLKLRATTNGAILQAGGTISFRAKESLERKTEPTSFQPMRRCHTLILDGQNDTISKRKSAPAHAEFRRSQTLLYVGYNRKNMPENISKNVDYNPQPTPLNISGSSTLKVNKYNKKRKAPPAPTKNLSTEEVTSLAQNQNDLKNTALVKPRIYTTNASKAQVAKKTFQSATLMVTPFQRDFNVQSSFNPITSRQIQHTTSSYASKLPFRIENNFDAKLLNQNKPNDCSASTETANDRKISSPNSNNLEYELERVPNHVNEKKKLVKEDDVAANDNVVNINKTYHSLKADYAKDKFHVEEEKFLSNKITKSPNIEDHSLTTNERKIKNSQSRIPQLKRTFYFGMGSVSKPANLSATSPTSNTPDKTNEHTIREKDDSLALNRKMDAEEEIVDNGILIHVRPTLPRRQLETPSFSPAAAWRNLLEEQQYLQLERSKLKHNSSEQRILETPICLKSSAKENPACTKANWTPQQDLDDDDDEEGKEFKKADEFTNSLHVFSLSLPRDVHLQCQPKSSTKSAEQENNLKPTNCWLVPGFNSLQKFKTQLGNPMDFRSNNECTCTAKAANSRHNYELENTFANSLAIASKIYHQPYCELNKTPAKPNCYQNTNWLLHKSKSKDLSSVNTSKILGESCLKPSANPLSFIHFQPKSLSNICSGKHIVYLPGQDALNSSIKNNCRNSKQNKTNKSSNKRQRQSQENVRENLQDLPPIQNTHQSNASVPEKNSHRFSFQSTVRVLEKRRLAEKLSKDAEVQEAQRLNELEVMKRVEEDFQRKRAPEKANLRKQMRLHFKANADNAEYRSLPLNINEKFNSHDVHNQQLSDANNNVFCRAEPDGAVSPSTELNDDLRKLRHSNFLLSSTMRTSRDLNCFAYDGEESESETPLSDLQCTALLIEPYLNSVI